MAMAVCSSYKTNEGSFPDPRDASFSSYLDAEERDFVRNLAESIHSLSPARDASSPRVSIRRNQIPRSELGVFGAEKYFNEQLNDEKSVIPGIEGGGRHKPEHRKETKEDEDFYERKSNKSSANSGLKSPTPSLRSEGSWNSQIGLLMQRKVGVGLRIFSGFQCKGTCFNKKSVYTATSHKTTHSPTYYLGHGQRKSRVSHQKHLTFPIIDTASPHLYGKSKALAEEARKSLDVFGIRKLGKQDIEKNLERKLSILSWDAIPNNSPKPPLPFPFPNTQKSTPSDIDQDARSDASSDLFEIANLSGIEPGLATSQATDISSICNTPLTHHGAPSEASIEWSVITASAADFSVVSDYMEDENVTVCKKIITHSNKVQRNSSANGLLLGCKNHKAVDVVGNNYRLVKK